jgi:hypothetical protein
MFGSCDSTVLFGVPLQLTLQELDTTYVKVNKVFPSQKKPKEKDIQGLSEPNEATKQIENPLPTKCIVLGCWPLVEGPAKVSSLNSSCAFRRTARRRGSMAWIAPRQRPPPHPQSCRCAESVCALLLHLAPPGRASRGCVFFVVWISYLPC